MVVAIKVIAVAFILAGAVYIVRPAAVRGLIAFFKKGKRIYVSPAVRFALAILFFVAAGECKNRWVVLCFGMLFFVSALLIVGLGAARLGRILEWFERQSHLLYRFAGAATVAVGVVILLYA